MVFKEKEEMKMAYKIQIKNRYGTLYSRKFSSKKAAQSIMKANRHADSKWNKMGYQRSSDGKISRINNKYALVRITKVRR